MAFVIVVCELRLDRIERCEGTSGCAQRLPDDTDVSLEQVRAVTQPRVAAAVDLLDQIVEKREVAELLGDVGE